MPLIYGEALDRLRVRLNMYLVSETILNGTHLTMHRTNGLSDYWTIRMCYQAQELSIYPSTKSSSPLIHESDSPLVR